MGKFLKKFQYNFNNAVRKYLEEDEIRNTKDNHFDDQIKINEPFLKINNSTCICKSCKEPVEMSFIIQDIRIISSVSNALNVKKLSLQMKK